MAICRVSLAPIPASIEVYKQWNAELWFGSKPGSAGWQPALARQAVRLFHHSQINNLQQNSSVAKLRITHKFCRRPEIGETDTDAGNVDSFSSGEKVGMRGKAPSSGKVSPAFQRKFCPLSCLTNTQ